MTSAGGGDAQTAGAAGQSSSGDAVISREDLASKLRELAEELPGDARRLKRAQREKNQTMAGLWEAGLVEVRGLVDRVDQIWADYQKIDNEELEASGTAPAALTQLEQAVDDAIVAINRAIDSLEQGAESTSDNYRKAADQLSELAERCQGLVVHLRGPDALDE
jgi:chromosome segregation ATPase